MKNSGKAINDQEFLVAYGSLYDEFWNCRGTLRTYFYPLFLLRRLGYALVQIFFNDFPEFQAYFNVGFSLVIFAYLVKFQVFRDKLILASQILGELCVLIVFTTSSFFLYSDNSDDMRIIEDICIYSIICTIGIQFLINIIIFFKEMKKLWAEIIKSKSIQFKIEADQILSADAFN